MSDARRKAERPTGDQAGAAVDPTFRPPGSDAKPESPADAAASAAINQTPAAHQTPGNVGAAIAEEHGAPAPTARIAPKLWILGGLVALIAVIALASSL